VAAYRIQIVAFLTAFAWSGAVGAESPNALNRAAGTQARSSQWAIPEAEVQSWQSKTGAPLDLGAQMPLATLTDTADDANLSPLTRNRGGTGELFYKMMLSVLLVIGLGAGAIYASKKVLGKITNLPGKKIKVVETVYIGPRKAVHLLEVDNRRILIGSTNDNITKLADLTPDAVMQQEVFGEDSPGRLKNAASESPSHFPEIPQIGASSEFRPNESLTDLSTAYREGD